MACQVSQFQSGATKGWSAFQSHDLPPGPIVRMSFSRDGGYEAAPQI
jgi:hypothetical protein